MSMSSTLLSHHTDKECRKIVYICKDKKSYGVKNGKRGVEGPLNGLDLHIFVSFSNQCLVFHHGCILSN